ncbi:MAG TPA: ISAzo13 family transposase, partial [Campylobacterales bacterium]|nr:ISAzo13 family transposase [Campylobacterales bacterium]
MKNFYNSLAEKDRRRYAGIEATKLGRGGISYICTIFECDYSGVSRGQKELTSKLDKNDKRQR